MIFELFLLSHFPCNVKYRTLHRVGNQTHYQVYECVTHHVHNLESLLCVCTEVHWCQVKKIFYLSVAK